METTQKALNQTHFSYFKKPVQNTVPKKSVGILDVYRLVKGKDFKSNTEELRKLNGSNSFNKAKEFKGQSFDFVTFSGVFNERKSSELREHTGLIVFDFDDLKDIKNTRELLLSDQYFDTQLLFTSPSGNGLKWIVNIDTSTIEHKTWFQGVKNYIESTYDLQVDKSGADVTRACFLPHDPNVFIHPKYLGQSKNSRSNMSFDLGRWTHASKSKKSIPENLSSKPFNLQKAEAIVSKIERYKIDITEEYDHWIKIGFALVENFGESGRNLFHRISSLFPNYDSNQCDDKYSSFLKSEESLPFGADRTTLGTFFHFARQAISQYENARAFQKSEILARLIEQIEPIDFEAEANPHGAENFKTSNKHYVVISIGNILEIADRNQWGLCRNHDFIYLFNGKYWEELDKDLFQKFLGSAAEKMGVPFFTAQHFRFTEDLYKQFLAKAYREPNTTIADKVLINLLNGTFEVSQNRTILRPHDSSDFLTYQLPFEYDTEAKAPLFESYLNKVVPDKKSQKILAEYLGFVFMKHGGTTLKLEKTLILYGTGANGKSVFFEVVGALLGDKNTSNFTLQNLTNDNGYYRAKLANKLVNYASEINGRMESSIFKQLVSGEPVEARLPYGDPFMLRQYAKLIFNCNELPRDVEHTNAFFRRFLIVPFEVTIPKEEQDSELHTKIIQRELSGVFNWVLEGLDRLLNQKGFTESAKVQKAIDSYEIQSDSVKMFVNESGYKESFLDYTTIKQLYYEYAEYCQEDGFKPVSKLNFRKRLQSFDIVVKKMNVGNVAYLSKIEDKISE